MKRESTAASKRRPFALRSLVLSLVPVLFAPAFVLGEPKDEVVVVGDVWCPYNCEETAIMPGILIEAAREALALQHKRLIYRTLPWSRALEQARLGAVHGIVGVYRSDAPDFHFPATPLSEIRNGFFILRGNRWLYNGLASLESVRLGAIQDYGYSQSIDRYIERHRRDRSKVQVISGDNALQRNLQKLLRNRIDVVVEDPAVMNHLLAREGLVDRVVMVGLEPGDSIYVAFSPSHPDGELLANELDKGLKELQNSGRLAQIIRRYPSATRLERSVLHSPDIPQEASDLK
ncbi:MAG: transporter substrate-binding domain-containing protein [Bdellovibrionales bacterium]|nr:transporter substrate-binding domain-containing protein [Bdellovibrionales bacterium]